MSEATVVSGAGLTIGLDIGDRMSEVCVLDGEGVVLERGRVATNEEAMRHRFGGARVLVALETGTHSAWISELLESLGHEVIVANGCEALQAPAGNVVSMRAYAEGYQTYR